MLRFVLKTFEFLFFFHKRIIEVNGGQPPLTYKRFQSIINCMRAVDLPAENITSEVIETCATPIGEDYDNKFGVPSLEELGEFLGFFFFIL